MSTPTPRRPRQFLTPGSPVTAPTAEPAPVPATTSRRPDAKTSQETPTRAAFTWRRTPDQTLAMDELTIRLKRQLGRAKLDQADILAALVALAGENPAVFGALTGRLQDQDA